MVDHGLAGQEIQRWANSPIDWSLALETDSNLGNRSSIGVHARMQIVRDVTFAYLVFT